MVFCWLWKVSAWMLEQDKYDLLENYLSVLKLQRSERIWFFVCVRPGV